MTGLANLLVTLMTPALLVLGNILLVMTPFWLSAAYTRPGFPRDSYGLSTSDRIELAALVTNWLGNDQELNALADLITPDGQKAFNARELRHLLDVKLLTGHFYRLAFTALTLLGVGSAICHRRGVLRQALQRAAHLTLALLLAILVFSAASWDQAFTEFHRLFFASGTWYFAYSDTLIRLFPERFWIDALLFLAGLTALQALALIWLTSPTATGWKTLRQLIYWRRRDSGVTGLEQAKRP
ncbi:MAG: TIGR01906 family membrane protein [Anaerolineaceae bacterium]|nr:TIGR01906 family membrane protein [Anaerolineaceae bacterium]